MADDCVLTTGHLELRTPRLDDADALCLAARESVALVGRWLPWCHAAYDHADSLAFIEASRAAWQRDEAYPFLIFDQRDQTLVGGCAINEIDPVRRRGNLGYWVRAARHRQGIATSAARRLARWGFETLRLQRLEIVAAEGNTASQRTAIKIGAQLEGLARHRLRIREVPHHACVYSLIPTDTRLWHDD